MPVVCASRPPAGFDADHVLVDDVGGARSATDRLLALGRRRIGFLGPPAAVYTSTERPPDPPTALFCSNNPNTIGAFRAVTAVVGDTAPAGFDDFELADALGLPLVIQAYDSAELGREAGRLLVDRMRNAPSSGAPARCTVVPTRAVRYGTPRSAPEPHPAP